MMLRFNNFPGDRNRDSTIRGYPKIVVENGKLSGDIGKEITDKNDEGYLERIVQNGRVDNDPKDKIEVGKNNEGSTNEADEI